jgi:hypothetical protein
VTFLAEDRSVPSAVRTDEFVLEPLTVAHVEVDHAALMAGVGMLRLWGGTSWPSADFSVEDNLRDLELHEREHRERVAFTYTVLTPEKDECLGCVYVTPLTHLVGANADVLVDVPVDAAVVRFWITQPRLDDVLDERLLATLRRWFAEEWPFSTVSYCTREANTQQLQMMEAAGLARRYSVVFPHRAGSFVLLGDD